MGLGADGVAEIGYGTYTGFEGKGYMTEAVMVLVQWASRKPGVLRIEAKADKENKASQRVLEKPDLCQAEKSAKKGHGLCGIGRENENGSFKFAIPRSHPTAFRFSPHSLFPAGWICSWASSLYGRQEKGRSVGGLSTFQ